MAIEWTDAPEHGVRFRAANLVDGPKCESVRFDDLPKLMQRPEGCLWLDVRVSDTGAALPALVEHLGFHELAVEDALNDTERPTVHEYEDYLFLTAVHIEHEDHHECFTEVGVFLGRSYLVTVSRTELPELVIWFDRWCNKPVEVATTPTFLLHTVFDEIVDRYFPITDDVENDVDELEDRIYDGHPVQVPEILRIKRRLHELRRRISPVRDTLNTLLRRDITLIHESARPYLQDVYDHSLRVVERIDLNRDILSDVLDAHLNVVSNNLNLVVKRLTVASTVLMSMALVSGVYGMNFRHMPELVWPYGYAFALGLMASIATTEIWLFKKIGWL